MLPLRVLSRGAASGGSIHRWTVAALTEYDSQHRGAGCYREVRYLGEDGVLGSV